MRGAINGSHIAIKAPEECPENYINRKHFHSVNLMSSATMNCVFSITMLAGPEVCMIPGFSKTLISIKQWVINSKVIPTSWGILHTLWRLG